MSPYSLQLVVVLDMTTKPPSVKDVVVLQLNGHPAYNTGSRWPTCAILTEVTARGPIEANHAMKGLIENEPSLAWVKEYPEIKQWLNPPRW